jgi:anthranilate/para-aminobenzoate synthase component II
MPPIALLTSRAFESIHGDFYESTPSNLSSILIGFGYLPISLSNRFPTEEKVLQVLGILSPKLIVLAGGEDLGVNVDRDRTEGYLLNYASAHSDVKVLGICRGMQFIAYQFGCTLSKIENHVAAVHPVFDKDRYLGEVNSFHSYQVQDLPNCLEVTSSAQDGSIESFRHRDLPWYACMWHPERMKMSDWMTKILGFEDVT